jgi:hypothetical protein
MLKKKMNIHIHGRVKDIGRNQLFSAMEMKVIPVISDIEDSGENIIWNT